VTVTEVPRSKPRRRRGRMRTAEPRVCGREGRDRITVHPRHTTCSLLCRAVVDALDEAQRVCAATGDTAHWLSAVDLNDSLSAFNVSDARIYRAALDSGINSGQWRSIKSGL